MFKQSDLKIEIDQNKICWHLSPHFPYTKHVKNSANPKRKKTAKTKMMQN
jgi:hypothetical protein